MAMGMPRDRTTAAKPIMPPISLIAASCCSLTRSLERIPRLPGASLDTKTQKFSEKFPKNEVWVGAGKGNRILAFWGWRIDLRASPEASVEKRTRTDEKKNFPEGSRRRERPSDSCALAWRSSERKRAGKAEELGREHRLQHREPVRGKVGRGGQQLRQRARQAQGARDAPLLQHHRGQP